MCRFGIASVPARHGLHQGSISRNKNVRFDKRSVREAIALSWNISRCCFANELLLVPPLTDAWNRKVSWQTYNDKMKNSSISARVVFLASAFRATFILRRPMRSRMLSSHGRTREQRANDTAKLSSSVRRLVFSRNAHSALLKLESRPQMPAL